MRDKRKSSRTRPLATRSETPLFSVFVLLLSLALLNVAPPLLDYWVKGASENNLIMWTVFLGLYWIIGTAMTVARSKSRVRRRRKQRSRIWRAQRLAVSNSFWGRLRFYIAVTHPFSPALMGAVASLILLTAAWQAARLLQSEPMIVTPLWIWLFASFNIAFAILYAANPQTTRGHDATREEAETSASG